MITISARNLIKKFGDVTVIHNVSLRIPPGKITGFLGPNGAGKTTLFYLLSGDIPADSGRVFLESTGGRLQELGKFSRYQVARSGIGFLYQDVRTFETLSIIDNVIVAMNDSREDNPFWDLAHLSELSKLRLLHWEQASHWLEYVGLCSGNTDKHRLERKAAELSYGEKKLLAFAQLLSRKCGMLLLDEPMAGLNEYYARKIELLLRQLSADKSVTIAIIEHDIQMLRRVAEFLFFMAEGELIFFGLTEHVLGNEEIRRTFIGME